MDLDGYSLKGGKFSVTGGGFTGTLTTEEDGISNHLQLPNNAYQTAVANVMKIPAGSSGRNINCTFK